MTCSVVTRKIIIVAFQEALLSWFNRDNALLYEMQTNRHLNSSENTSLDLRAASQHAEGLLDFHSTIKLILTILD